MIFYGVKKMKNKNRGFTIIELLIVVAIISILASIGIPVFSNSLEKSRESVDIANVRAAYADVMTSANLGEAAVKIVHLNQKKDGWQSMNPVKIGGIIHYKNQGDTDNWKGNPVAGGICEVSYNESCGAVFTWSSKTDSSVPKYPFDTGITAKQFSLCFMILTSGRMAASIILLILNLIHVALIPNIFRPSKIRLKN